MLLTEQHTRLIKSLLLNWVLTIAVLLKHKG